MLVMAAIGSLPAIATKVKLTPEERMELIRGLSAEYATVKQPLPKSKKALSVSANAKVLNQAAWERASKEMGTAAKTGDTIQVTAVEVNDDSVVLEINGGLKSGVKWYDRIQVGMGSSGRTTPVSQSGSPTEGTNLAVEFPDGVPPLTALEFKRQLAPLLDFDKRSATEDPLVNLPPEIKSAILDKRAVEGMTRDQVITAAGHPRHKTRESKEGVEQEDWIYGLPPGKITFVTFEGDVVIKVKDTYAGLGGSTAPKLDPH
jgi:hypothetical protein